MTSVRQDNHLTEAERAADRSPNDAQLHIELGKAYFDAGRFDEALASFTRAVDLASESAEAHNWIGRTYYHLGPPHKGVDAYRRVAELDPQYADAYFGLGLIYLWQIGDNEAAMDAIRTGLEHNPDNQLLTTLLGTAYGFAGRFDDAIVALEQSIRLQPDNAWAYGWLAIVYLNLGRYNDMIDACQREIEIEDSHDPRRMLGLVYARQGRPDRALDELQHAVDLDPDDYEARALLARVYRSTGRLKEADDQYALARRQAMEDDAYGQSCFEAVNGNVEQSLALLKAAVTGKPATLNWARIDPELTVLHEDARFQSLTAAGS